MARTILQLKTWAAENLHEEEDDEAFETLFPRWVTQVHNRITTYKAWNWNSGMVPLVWPAIAAGAEGAILYLPSYIDKILTIYPGSAVGIGKITIITPTELDRWRPVAGRDVGRDYMVQWGFYGIRGELPADGVVTMTSSAGVGNQTCLVEGLDANDDELREEITVAGAGATAGTSVFKAGVDGVRRITLIGDGTGVPVTTTGIITAAGGGVNLFRCDSAYETSKDHQRTELHAVASAQNSYTCRFYRKHLPFTRDQDVVYLPEKFDDVLEFGLSEKVAMFRKRIEEVSYFKSEFNSRLKELIAWDNRQPGKKWNVKPRRQWGNHRSV